MSKPEAQELYRFAELAYDVGLIFGSTTDQGLERAKRCLNRAAAIVAGSGRRWSWLRTTDSLTTVAAESDYSLPSDYRKEEMFWIQDNGRQKLDRISDRRLRELAPDQSVQTGRPRLYTFNGVDSSGCKVASFFPAPADSDTEIWFRYSRFILPIRDDQKDVRAAWGMPPNVLECLIQTASALAIQGVNSSRYFAMIADARTQIEDAYGEDQAHPDATYQARMVGGNDQASGDPSLPPEYDRL